MASTKLDIQHQQLSDALSQLQKLASLGTFTDVERDATIQRFEYTFELAWKYLKSLLADQGVFEYSPAKVLKAAFRAGMIEDLALWLTLLEKRNLTVHTYNVETAQEVVAYAPELVEMVKKLLS